MIFVSPQFSRVFDWILRPCFEQAPRYSWDSRMMPERESRPQSASSSVLRDQSVTPRLPRFSGVSLNVSRLSLSSEILLSQSRTPVGLKRECFKFLNVYILRFKDYDCETVLTKCTCQELDRSSATLGTVYYVCEILSMIILRRYKLQKLLACV